MVIPVSCRPCFIGPWGLSHLRMDSPPTIFSLCGSLFDFFLVASVSARWLFGRRSFSSNMVGKLTVAALFDRPPFFRGSFVFSENYRCLVLFLLSVPSLLASDGI